LSEDYALTCPISFTVLSPGLGELTVSSDRTSISQWLSMVVISITQSVQADGSLVLYTQGISASGLAAMKEFVQRDAACYLRLMRLFLLSRSKGL
jgi:hypothetical protein